MKYNTESFKRYMGIKNKKADLILFLHSFSKKQIDPLLWIPFNHYS